MKSFRQYITEAMNDSVPFQHDIKCMDELNKLANSGNEEAKYILKITKTNKNYALPYNSFMKQMNDYLNASNYYYKLDDYKKGDEFYAKYQEGYKLIDTFNDVIKRNNKLGFFTDTFLNKRFEYPYEAMEYIKQNKIEVISRPKNTSDDIYFVLDSSHEGVKKFLNQKFEDDNIIAKTMLAKISNRFGGYYQMKMNTMATLMAQHAEVAYAWEMMGNLQKAMEHDNLFNNYAELLAEIDWQIVAISHKSFPIIGLAYADKEGKNTLKNYKRIGAGAFTATPFGRRKKFTEK